MITLGIETSCDETSIAILRDGSIMVNKIYSQVEHTRFGGVVPEIASRAHLEKIGVLTDIAFAETSLTTSDIDLIAVTDSPGLAGALLIGVSFSLGLHARRGIPLAGINHLEGHICSIFLDHPGLELPFLALVVSGGHSAIYVVHDIGRYTCLGQTVDDAAGEAFDKVGKLLGFPYPAGRAIELEARKCPATDITFPVPRVSGGPLDFSFSGLKTAVKYFISSKGQDFVLENRAAICRAFQETVTRSLLNNCASAMQSTGIPRVALVGGVACNTKLRESMQERLGPENVYYPAPVLCADNGAMIACAGYKRALLGITRHPHMNPGGTL